MTNQLDELTAALNSAGLKAEDVIRTDPECAGWYARDVIL